MSQRELKLILAMQLKLTLHVTLRNHLNRFYSKPYSSKNQNNLELVVTNSEKTKAEIIWAIKSITAGNSNKSCSDNDVLFQIIFSDSKIVKSFQLLPTKLKYLINFEIAPYFKSLLVERLTEIL